MSYDKKYNKVPFSNDYPAERINVEVNQLSKLADFNTYSKKRQYLASLIFGTKTYGGDMNSDSLNERFIRSAYFFTKCNKPITWNANNFAFVMQGIGLVFDIISDIFKDEIALSAAAGSLGPTITTLTNTLKNFFSDRHIVNGAVTIDDPYEWMNNNYGKREGAQKSEFNTFVDTHLTDIKSCIAFSIIMYLYREILEVLRRLNPYKINKRKSPYASESTYTNVSFGQFTNSADQVKKRKLNGKNKDKSNHTYTNIEAKETGAAGRKASNYRSLYEPLLTNYSVYFPLYYFGNFFIVINNKADSYTSDNSAIGFNYYLGCCRDLAKILGCYAKTLLCYLKFITVYNPRTGDPASKLNYYRAYMYLTKDAEESKKEKEEVLNFVLEEEARSYRPTLYTFVKKYRYNTGQYPIVIKTYINDTTTKLADSNYLNTIVTDLLANPKDYGVQVDVETAKKDYIAKRSKIASSSCTMAQLSNALNSLNIPNINVSSGMLNKKDITMFTHEKKNMETEPNPNENPEENPDGNPNGNNLTRNGTIILPDNNNNSNNNSFGSGNVVGGSFGSNVNSFSTINGSGNIVNPPNQPVFNKAAYDQFIKIFKQNFMDDYDSLFTYQNGQKMYWKPAEKQVTPESAFSVLNNKQVRSVNDFTTNDYVKYLEYLGTPNNSVPIQQF